MREWPEIEIINFQICWLSHSWLNKLLLSELKWLFISYSVKTVIRAPVNFGIFIGDQLKTQTTLTLKLVRSVNKKCTFKNPLSWLYNIYWLIVVSECCIQQLCWIIMFEYIYIYIPIQLFNIIVSEYIYSSFTK